MPPIVAISIGAGGQDAQGSERGFEYDAVNGAYAEFVENEVLPLAEKTRERQAHQESRRPRDDGHQLERIGGLHDGLVPSRALPSRAALFADGGEPAMAAQSGPAGRRLGISQRWAGPPVADLSVEGGKVTKSDTHFGSPLIPNSPTKPIRIWFETGDQDLFYPVTPVADGMHDWVLADERFAKVLADKGYHYQFLFARNAQHVDKATVAQTLARGARMAMARVSGAIAARVHRAGPESNSSRPASRLCACR